MISGHATVEGTRAYTLRHAELRYQPLAAEGLLVSQAGYGCYRVDVSVEEHQRSLRQAILGGVNLIDTSSNYADGGSEELVGAVLSQMIANGEVEREAVVVVSKVGYLQGQNYALSQERKREGRPFPDLVLYGQGLEHCLHPEFLADQLTRSLGRLQMETLDCYLLHNPEYYLGWAKQAGLSVAKAREEYYNRIELAFRYLETEVERGRIRSYGISSNTFPAAADDDQFTSLEQVWEIAHGISAEHHLQVIQLPMNLYETGGVTEPNQSGAQSVISFAREKGLGVLINRPLNAVRGGQLMRLADVPVESEVDVEQVTGWMDDLVLEETHLRDELLVTVPLSDSEREQVSEKIAAGQLLHEHWQGFAGADHWRDVLGRFLVPTVQGGLQVLLNRGAVLPESVVQWIEGYADKVNRTLQGVSAYYELQAAERSEGIKRQVEAADPEWGAAVGLSRMAIRALRSTAGITTVLVGMRRAVYVEDVLAEMRQNVDVRERDASWQHLQASWPRG